MKIFFLVVGLSLFQQNAFTQINKDSLLYVLKTAENDSVKALTLKDLSEYYLRLKPDTSLLLVQQSIEIARKIKSKRIEAAALFLIAKVYEFLGNYTTALEMFLESLKIHETLNDKSMVASSLLFIGDIYRLQNNYRESLSYYFKAIDISKDLRDTSDLRDLLAWVYLGIGDTYENLDQLDSAQHYIGLSYDLIKSYNIPYLKGRALKTFGNIYAKKGGNTRAMGFYRESIIELEKTFDFLAISQTKLGIARLYKKTGPIDSSVYYAKESLDIAQNGSFLLEELKAAVFLSEYYKSIHEIDSAFIYQEITISAKDSLFSREKIIDFQNVAFNEQLNQQKITEAKEQYRNEIKMYILIGGVIALLLIAGMLLRNIRNKQKANLLLHRQKKEIDAQRGEIEKAFNELTSAQAQLIQSEKMASLGELTAGIAHEIQNPLNFVNNFSEVNNELIEELKSKKSKLKTEEQYEILNDIFLNNEKINHHGKRADAIVKGMLQHSRQSSGKKEQTDINALADEYLRLAYHGLRAKDKSFNAEIKTEFDESIGNINIISQDIGRVLLNLYNNAFYAVIEKKKQAAKDLLGFKNLTGLNDYDPTVTVSTKKINDKIEIRVADNGSGIPQKIVDKIFQPFFTTKPTGQGTGLGLSLSYDIIKAHGGEIKVESIENDGSEFIIQLPV